MNRPGIGGKKVSSSRKYSSSRVRPPPNPHVKSNRMNRTSTRTQKRAPQVPKNEFYREHGHWRLVDLHELKKKMDDILKTPDKRRLFWSAFRNFMTAKISKTEFTRIVKDRIRVPEMVPLFNYFVRSLLHNSRIKHRDPPIATNFEDFFNTFHQTKNVNREGGFGTLFEPQMIDFHRFSIESTTPGYVGKTYGHPTPSSFIDHRKAGENAMKEKMVRNLVRHSIRNHSPTIPIVLFRAVEMYLKRIVARVIEFKTHQRNIERYRNDDLRGVRVGSHHFQQIRSMSIPGVEEDYHHYRHDVNQAAQRQKKMDRRLLREQDIRKLEVLKRLKISDMEIYRLRRHFQLSMKTDDISKYLYPDEDSKYLISRVMDKSTQDKIDKATMSTNTTASKTNGSSSSSKSNNPLLSSISRQQMLQIQQFKEKQKEEMERMLLNRQKKQKEEMDRRKRIEQFSYDDLDITQFFPTSDGGDHSYMRTTIDKIEDEDSIFRPPKPPEIIVPPASQQKERMVDEDENGPELPFDDGSKYDCKHPIGRKFNFIRYNDFGYSLKKRKQQGHDEDEDDDENENEIEGDEDMIFSDLNNDLVRNDDGYERREVDFFEEVEDLKLDLVITAKDLLDAFLQNPDIIIPNRQKIMDVLLTNSIDMV